MSEPLRTNGNGDAPERLPRGAESAARMDVLPPRGAEITPGIDAQPLHGAEAAPGNDAHPFRDVETAARNEIQPSCSVISAPCIDAQPPHGAEAAARNEIQPPHGAEAAPCTDAQPPRGAEAAPREEGALPMRWHVFLVRGMLFPAAALHALQAWWVFSGRIYHDAQVRAAVYAGLPALRALDWFLAGMLIVGAALQIAARFALSARRARGPALLKAAYGALLGGVAAYALGRLFISALSPLSLPVLGQAGAYLGLLLVNAAYYRKRRGAFAPAKGEKE